jgi:cytochrome c oxidase assembly protein subunit 15
VKNNTLLYISRFACVLAFIVITVGAYTRLSHAGLGCPDWPGCYGKMIVPAADEHVMAANEAFPERPLNPDKAWIEMAHRYIAGTLGILILSICLIAWIKNYDSSTRWLSLALLGMVIFQALLGMWTVTLLLKPLIVMMHLLGGMTILGLLYWLSIRLKAKKHLSFPSASHAMLPWALGGLIVLALQISLGGWTSTNYAALACPDFPTCHGVAWPVMDFKEAFVLWRGLGIDYEGGVLDGPARTAIHMTHRIGAVITLLVLLSVAIHAIRLNTGYIRYTGAAIICVLLLQLSLGIANVVMHLPLYIAVAHNGVAALLLLSLVTLLHQSLPIQKR